jgi:prolipoprotein diacylglyceryltransferase
MWPSLTLPGTGVTISSYHLFHVIGWFTFYLVGSWLTRSRPDLKPHWGWLFVGFALCDTVGARAAFRLIRGSDENGFFGGPLLFAVLSGAYVVARKVRAYPFLDAWAIAFSAAHVFEKGACLAAGCCFGRPTDLAFGVARHAAPGDPTRWHPLPLYEASLHLLTALGLGLLYARGRFRGRLVMLLGATYGLWRSAAELARDGRKAAFLDGPLTYTQVACVLAIAFSVTYLLSSRADGRRALNAEG